jgi:hypothetical protein
MRAFLAKMCHTLETKPVLVKAHVLDFTEKSCVSLASFDQSTSSWKTSQQSLLTDSALCLETFPRWGTMRDGVLFQHPMSGLTIRENAGGVSAPYGTPRATQTGRAALRGGSGNQWLQKKLELGEVSEEEAYVMIGQKPQVMLGTPAASMWKGIDHKRALSGEHRGNLKDQIAHQEYTKLGLNTDKKQEVMQMLPTPMAQDTIPRNNPAYVQRRRELGLPITLQMQIGGLLAPEFVEFMMGFPINYTKTKLRPDSSALAMPKSRSVAQSRGRYLREIWSFK